MNIVVLGGDGYLGWPTAMHFASLGHDVTVVDNYLRRRIAEETDSEALIPTPTMSERSRVFEQLSGHRIHTVVGDCLDHEVMNALIRDAAPDAVIHYAEQPSAPYSMRDARSARLTLHNNVGVTFNLIVAVLEHVPNCHIVKLGTMGEYGTPNIDIEEGWIDINHKGRSGRFLFPRAAGSLYHTTKVLDTDLLWFYCRTYDLRVTDLMQGPVYGLDTPQTILDDRLLPNFHYDDIFGTALNRFVVQAVAGIPLTVYGKGGQTRGYLNLLDTLSCVQLAVEHPVDAGDLRILNQFTETFSVNALAALVQEAGRQIGLDVHVQSVSNPRKEAEDHYYNPAHTGLIELGLSPTLLTPEVLIGMIRRVQQYAQHIKSDQILPRVRWS